MTFVSQLSVAVKVAAVGTASHSTISSDGAADKTGASVSELTIRCVPTLTLPQLSVAVHVLMITTPAAQSPVPASVLSSYTTSTSVSQSSVAVTVGTAISPDVPQLASVSDGMPDKIGAVVSSTVIT